MNKPMKEDLSADELEQVSGGKGNLEIQDLM